MKFYKRDPDRALAGMNELTLKQRGAYNSILDLLYSRDGDVPDDDARVARMICCNWREWKAVKAELIALGKIWLEGGKIRAKRVQETIREASDFSQEQCKKASERWQKSEKPSENNDPVMPQENASRAQSTPTPTPTDSVREVNLSNRAESPPDPVPMNSETEALAEWNALAQELGLPKVQRMTAARRKRLTARLRDCGGIDGWRVAMVKIRGSPFLRGEKTDWRADFDFVLQQSSFVKIMEGKYDGTCQQTPAGNSVRDHVAKLKQRAVDAKLREIGEGRDGGGPDLRRPA